MRKRCFASLTILSICTGLLQGCPPHHPPVTTTEVEGTWAGASYVSGSPLFEDESYSEIFKFQANDFEVIVQNPGQNPAAIRGTFTVDPAADTINVNVEESPGGEQGLSLGVYSVEGATLYMAFGGIGNPRPSHDVLDPAIGPVFVGDLTETSKEATELLNGGGLLN